MARTAATGILAFGIVAIVGLALTQVAPELGTVVAVAGLVGLVAFLLRIFRIASTTTDQWVWQTPGKPRREYLAEQAAQREAAKRDASSPTGGPPVGPA